VRDRNIGLVEIRAFEQHWLSRLGCERISAAVENVQLRGMAHSLAETPVGLECEPGLVGRESRDLDSALAMNCRRIAIPAAPFSRLMTMLVSSRDAALMPFVEASEIRSI